MNNNSETEKNIVADGNTLPWEERPNPKTGRSYFRKMLIQDPDTGMRINLAHYPAGFKTPWHFHHCGKAMYVLEGVLKTNDGEYGPGNLIWFKEGQIHEHGATALTDVKVLFITNKKFDIEYVNKDQEHSQK